VGRPGGHEDAIGEGKGTAGGSGGAADGWSSDANGRSTVSIIGWVILGGIAGWIASKIAGTDSQQGWFMNIVLGIIGAIVGGFLWGLIRGEDVVTTFSIGSLLVAIVGALIVTWLVGLFTGRRA
jgi:uncharacterized membrane protein YeaQ/YmgE (transglycosylase-associated protein family)